MSADAERWVWLPSDADEHPKGWVRFGREGALHETGYGDANTVRELVDAANEHDRLAAALADDVDALARRCKAAEESYAIGRRLVDELRAALAAAAAENERLRGEIGEFLNGGSLANLRASISEGAKG